jgi:hypothetical protein
MLVIRRRTGAYMDEKKIVKPASKETIIAGPEKPWSKLEKARQYAYSLYEKRGYALGNELKAWVEAANREKNRGK